MTILTGAIGRRIERLLEARDWNGAAALVEAHWGEALLSEPHRLRAWLLRFPEDFARRNSRIIQGKVYLDRIIDDPAAHTTKFRGSTSASEAQSAFDRVTQLTIRAAAARAGGDLDEATQYALRARRIVDESAADERENMQPALPEMTYAWGYVWEQAGDLRAAFREYTYSYDLALLLGDLMGRARSAAAIAWCHALAGRNSEARRWLQRVPEMRDGWWVPRSRAVVMLAEALLLYDRLCFDEARERLSLVDLQAATERTHAHMYVSALLADSSAEAMRLMVGLEAPAMAIAHSASRGQSAAFVALSKHALLTRLGMHTAARDALGTDDDLGGEVVSALVRIQRIAADAHAGLDERVLRAASLMSASTSHTPRALVAALALRAAASRDLTIGAGADDFRLAASIASEQELYSPFVLLPRADVRRLAADSNGLSPDVVDAIVRAARVDAGDPFQKLTPRERAVLGVRLTDATLEEIATEHYLSVNTVKSQMRSAYRKLGISSVEELRSLAATYGFAP
ncbi:DNA-binding CsgD family transcriptional regulator [Microbacterium sp. SORGH_AS428]|nr:DNA-binding CsgD family transcriptional regulator [Microbacterium sp. SORGH_AS_0428]